MFVYSTVPAAAESVTTGSAMYTCSSAANSTTDCMRMVASTARNAYIQAVYVLGRGAGLTAFSGINLKIIRLGTPSTVGTAATPRPRDPQAQASTITASSGPTIGSTPTVQVSFGCGAAGPGGWVAPNPDSVISLLAVGSGSGNADLIAFSGTASLNFDADIEHFE